MNAQEARELTEIAKTNMINDYISDIIFIDIKNACNKGKSKIRISNMPFDYHEIVIFKLKELGYTVNFEIDEIFEDYTIYNLDISWE